MKIDELNQIQRTIQCTWCFMVKRNHAFLQDLLRHTFLINAVSTCSKLAEFTKPQFHFHNFLGTFTYLVTVYYTNILRRNWTIFDFIERKRLLDRSINITVLFSEITLFPLWQGKLQRRRHANYTSRIWCSV